MDSEADAIIWEHYTSILRSYAAILQGSGREVCEEIVLYDKRESQDVLLLYS